MMRLAAGWLAVLLCAGPAGAMDLGKAMAACPGAATYINAQIVQQRAHAPSAPPVVTDPALRQQLLQLQDEDQLQYEALAAGKPDTKALKRVQEAHLAYLQNVLGATGSVPGVEAIGRDGVGALWLLVQHADGDPSLQARALALLQPMAVRGDLDASKFALLTDRVLLASGKPQRFGSQLRDLDGKPLHLADEKAVRRERAALSLMDLDDYRCVSEQLYRAGP